MGKAIDMLSMKATGVLAGSYPGTLMTALSGDSTTLRDSAGSLLCGWSKIQSVAPGSVRVLQTSYPDQGPVGYSIRGAGAANMVSPVIWPAGAIPVAPQDRMTAYVQDQTAAGDVALAHLLLAYDDVQGVAQNLLRAPELESRWDREVTVLQLLAAQSAGAYGGEAAISPSSFGTLPPGYDYALLGMTYGDFDTAAVRDTVSAIYVRGPDTGGLRVGVPNGRAGGGAYDTRDFFLKMARVTGAACIPVISGSNASGMYVGVVADENATASTIAVWLTFVRLATRRIKK